jgi:DNA-binding MarR family transcriptional regulator
VKAKSRSHGAARRALPSRLDVDLSDRLAHLVKDAGKLLARALQSRLAERSIAYGHWTFLRILWKHNGISQTRLSQLAGVMAPSTFAAVRDMEKRGYIVRKQKPSNRKNVYIFLTPAGKALEAELVPLAVEVNNIAVDGLTRKQIADFRRALVAVIGNLKNLRHAR